ncbi:MAG: RodZ domain-containing protein [Vicinamibacteria bacterium]
MASFGESLRRERELRGVTLQEISASTKIGVSMLQAIEEDRLDKLPQGLFVRGFVREYARFLALDEQKILTDLSFHEIKAPVVDDSVGERGRRVSSRLSARLVNGTLAVVGFGAVAALILSPGLSRAPVPVASNPVLSPIPSRELPPNVVAANNVAPPTDLPASNSSGTQPVPDAPGATPGATPQPLQLTLTATEDCWIGLDVGGDRVENRVLKKGESVSILARQNASLAVGNAGGLLVAIDSGPGRPLGNRGEVKRNIPLSPEAISALSSVAQSVPAKPIG